MADLFQADETANLLPYEGMVRYLGPLMPYPKALIYLEQLLEQVLWKQDEVVLFGRRIITRRKVAWYGDQPYAYTYSNTTRYALPWNEVLAELKQLAEQASGESFNSCLLNLYHDGQDGMTWHSDDEKELEPGGTIASLSFGAIRKFAFRHKKSGETRSLLLEPGSLLLMQGLTQQHWLHALPKTTKVKTPRVNLTFRRMAPGNLV